jgi:N-acetylmuramoyl-L-alanine amidase
MSAQSGAGPGVAAVREQERLRTGLGSIALCRIVVGHYGGLSALTRTLARELRLRGATVMSLDEPDAFAQATAANNFAADAYIGLETATEPLAVVQYYRVPAFESVGGKALAELIAQRMRCLPDWCPDVRGMRLPMLRETRMPAVQCVFGPVRAAINAGPGLATAIVGAVEQWSSRST